MKPTLRQLRYLVAVADSGSFSAAARDCNVSQPSLSTQIADMEGVLGAALVERGRRTAQLTPLGHDIVDRARIVLGQMEGLRTLARESGNTLAGRIVLGILPSVGPYLLPAGLRMLHGDYPRLRFAIRELRTTDLDSQLRSGRLDVIVSTPEDHPDMQAMPLLDEELYIGVASDDPLAGKGPVPLSALSGRQVLTLGEGHKFARLVRDLANRAGAVVSSDYEGTSLDAVREMASMGGSVAVLPTLYARSEAMSDPGLSVRHLADPQARRSLSLIWRPSSPLSDKFRIIGDCLVRGVGDAARQA